MTPSQGEKGRSAGRQRLALLAFAGVLILLFLGFAIAQGIGHPSPSAGEVAVVEGVPDEIGTITEDDLELAIERTKQQVEEDPHLTPEDTEASKLRETALGSLLSEIWTQGEAEDLGISVTEQEVADAMKSFKNLPGNIDQEILHEKHATLAEYEESYKAKMLGEQIPEHTFEAEGPPSSDEIEDYYEAAVEEGQFQLSKSSEPESLEEAEPQIVSTLSDQIKSQAIQQFLNDFEGKWKARTFCAVDFAMESCAGFEGDSLPLCEKGNPKFGQPGGCKAPVAQMTPALPGSVSPLNPEGIKLAQRPVLPPLDPVDAAGQLEPSE